MGHTDSEAWRHLHVVAEKREVNSVRQVFALPPGGQPSLKRTVQEREGWAGSGFGVRFRWKGPPRAQVEAPRGGCRVRWGAGEGREACNGVQLDARRALSRREEEKSKRRELGRVAHTKLSGTAAPE